MANKLPAISSIPRFCCDQMKKNVQDGEREQESIKANKGSTKVYPSLPTGTAVECKCKSAKRRGQLVPVKKVSFCYFDELMDNWFRDLQEDEMAFLNQASEINKRDLIITTNQEQINMLCQLVDTISQSMVSLENDLEFMYCQHKELEVFLYPLLEFYNKVYEIDLPRYCIYSKAENLNSELMQLSGNLTQIILHLNAENGCPQQDAMSQLIHILNYHTYTLIGIDQRVSILEKEVQDVSKLHHCYYDMQQTLVNKFGFHVVKN